MESAKIDHYLCIKKTNPIFNQFLLTMKKILYAAVVIAMLASGCSSDEEPAVVVEPAAPFSYELTEAESQAAENIVDFESNLFVKIAESNEGNVVVSPIGATMYLSMLANCTDAETAAKIANVLGCADVEACNSLAAKYLNWLPKADPKVTVSFANGLWFRKGKTLNPDFSSAAANYRMDMFAEDFNDDKYLQGVIGSWADKKTGGLIKDLSILSFVDEPAVLANVTAFLGEWAEPFKKENTTTESFYGKYQTNNVEMMHQECTMAVNYTDKCQYVTLQFGSGRFDMTAILPDKGVDLSELYLDFKNIDLKRFSRRNVKLSLPKFKILPTTVIRLDKALSEMGLDGLNFKALYTDNNFSGNINEEIKINQLTAFEVHEKGVEAATITMNGMSGASFVPEGTVELTFNRPFLFVVHERSTGLTLFAGRIEQL